MTSKRPSNNSAKWRTTSAESPPKLKRMNDHDRSAFTAQAGMQAGRWRINGLLGTWKRLNK